MSRGRTNSSLNLGARREKARELYIRGFTVTEVAREVGVSPDTALRYKQQYQSEIAKQAAANPTLLRDVVKNTVGALAEIDQVRQEAWKQYEEASAGQLKATFLNTALKAAEQRNKLLQLFGVKAEYMSQVALIQQQQQRLIEFMSGQLCSVDRERLEDFLVAELSTDLEAMPTAAVDT